MPALPPLIDLEQPIAANTSQRSALALSRVKQMPGPPPPEDPFFDPVEFRVPKSVQGLLADWLGPTLIIIRTLKTPMYRVLQLIPVLLLLSIFMYVCSGVVWILFHPELWVDLGLAPFWWIPSYIEFAVPRMAARFGARVFTPMFGSMWGDEPAHFISSAATRMAHARLWMPGLCSMVVWVLVDAL